MKSSKTGLQLNSKYKLEPWNVSEVLFVFSICITQLCDNRLPFLVIAIIHSSKVTDE